MTNLLLLFEYTLDTDNVHRAFCGHMLLSKILCFVFYHDFKYTWDRKK